MARREVRQPLISYRDEDGLLHHALQGEHVDVGDSFLKEFDALNDPDGTHAPKREGGTPPKKAAAKTKPARKA